MVHVHTEGADDMYRVRSATEVHMSMFWLCVVLQRSVNLYMCVANEAVGSVCVRVMAGTSSNVWTVDSHRDDGGSMCLVT